MGNISKYIYGSPQTTSAQGRGHVGWLFSGVPLLSAAQFSQGKCHFYLALGYVFLGLGQLYIFVRSNAVNNRRYGLLKDDVGPKLKQFFSPLPRLISVLEEAACAMLHICVSESAKGNA